MRPPKCCPILRTVSDTIPDQIQTRSSSERTTAVPTAPFRVHRQRLYEAQVPVAARSTMNEMVDDLGVAPTHAEDHLRAIVTGSLQPDERLVEERSLAQRLGIKPDLVALPWCGSSRRAGRPSAWRHASYRLVSERRAVILDPAVSKAWQHGWRPSAPKSREHRGPQGDPRDIQQLKARISSPVPISTPNCARCEIYGHETTRPTSSARSTHSSYISVPHDRVAGRSERFVTEHARDRGRRCPPRLTAIRPAGRARPTSPAWPTCSTRYL